MRLQTLTLTSCLTISVWFAAGGALRAQNTNAPVAPPAPVNAAPSMQPRMRPLPPGASAAGPFAALSEEQRDSYQKILADQRDQLMELNSKLQAANQQISDAVLQTNVNEKIIREKVLAAAQIQAEMVILRAKALSQVQPPISAEQLEKMKNPRPMMPMQRPMAPVAPPSTNHDQNGLPPKQ
jgi:hypothetical protein